MDKQFHLTQTDKIIPLKLDANLYFRCAVKYLDKKDYTKALRFFRRTLEQESDNPINYFNLAGILSEMGKFEESNRVLDELVNSISPEMYECYYYMANNSANMADFESAELYTIKYLDLEPEGEYREEAEELLEFISEEIQDDAKSQQKQWDSRVKYQHVQSRKLLEEGSYADAITLLESMVSEHPDFVPAQNNLALAYHYAGKTKEATSLTRRILRKDKTNVHALCNLAFFYVHARDSEQVRALVSFLKKMIPVNPDQMFKLATTLGGLREHVHAYQLFRKLLKTTSTHNETLLHYMAVAAFNNGYYKEAENWWKKTKNMDPSSHVAPFHLTFLKRVQQGEEAWEELDYLYRLPINEYTNMGKTSPSRLNENLTKNPLVRSSFLWALKHGDKDTKLQVIQAFVYIYDAESEDILRQFLMHPTEDDELKIAAIFVLKMMEAREPYHVIIQNKAVMLDSRSLPRSLSSWIEKRQLVITCFQKHMKGRYEINEHHEAYKLWMKFISHVYPKGPDIRKEEGWAAAVEYIVARNHRSGVTQKEIARRYDVSVSTVAKKIRILKDICRVKTENMSKGGSGYDGRKNI